MACRRCARVWPMGRDRCGRCGGKLSSRDTKSLQKVWAWWIAGIVAYIPANIYPMLVTNTLVSSSESTIIGGAVEIAKYGSYGVAAIILIASVLIPVGKFLAIAFLALSSVRGSSVSPGRRTHLYEIVEFIGRWSMIDVFVVAILSSLVQLSVVASIRPGPAALTFALSVIFTMLSAQAFDPRLIWDAERRAPNGKTP
ncbi:paraquat-inducible protein A [Roseivivax lentus]|uniref:Paraquat-inducible protein A n=1 Tax=Roseivivax lentus TaxID=633194 RepID=A0A1N7P7T1_9RHOB|nr:paraquat-inducible protein A [Roseivivax lentus]